MEVRALAIAFFYAIGTAIGGITGPLVFERLASSGDPGQVAIGYLIGAGVMAIGGIVELILGVRAEQQQLEDIADAADRRGGRGRRRSRRASRERARADRAAAPRPRAERERTGRRRYRLGPGSASYSPFFPSPVAQRPEWIDVEVDRIAREVGREGEIDTRTLAATSALALGPGPVPRRAREAIARARSSGSAATGSPGGRDDPRAGRPCSTAACSASSALPAEGDADWRCERGCGAGGSRSMRRGDARRYATRSTAPTPTTSAAGRCSRCCRCGWRRR